MLSLSQLGGLGYNRMAVGRLVARGYLVRLYPAVYALGQPPQRVEGRLAAALFHAGPGAALSHTTAAWWWELIDAEPRTIHLVTSHRPAPARNLRIHRPRDFERTTHRRLPVTRPSRTLLDLADLVDEQTLRNALAQADHRKRLDPPSLLAQIRRGRPGGRALRCDLARLQTADPTGAGGARSCRFVPNAPPTDPELNIRSRPQGRLLLARQRLVVELDGWAAHAGPVANEGTAIAI